MRKKIVGISLLELMLALAIISIMLVAALRYYQTTRSSQEINEALTMLRASFTAADNWFVTYKDFENTPDGAINTEKLQGMGLLPKDFANPWGGIVTIAPVNASQIQITLDHISQADCDNLQAIMQKQGGQATCENETLSMSYSPQ